VTKDKVGRFDLLVAGEAAFHKRRVARFAVREVTEPPAAGLRKVGGHAADLELSDHVRTCQGDDTMSTSHRRYAVSQPFF
jgi:hypothetical protein